MEHTEQDIVDNMGLVYKIAHFMRAKHTNTHIDFDDLVSEGSLGLMDAFKKYDPERGAKFSTYAEYRIRGRMLDAYRESFWQGRAGRRRGQPAPNYVYLDADSYEEGSPLHELVPGWFLSEQDLINRLDVALVWEKVWRYLRPGEKRLFGLLRAGLIQAEAAKVLGVTESRVSQIYRRAQIRLRDCHFNPRRGPS